METTMKTSLVLCALLVSAAFVSPASANWFHNPTININLAIGSAPSPKPEDVRQNRQPILVRDENGDVIAMIDPDSGKTIAVAEPRVAQAANGAVRNTPPASPAR
jgi:hypothetical protein